MSEPLLEAKDIHKVFDTPTNLHILKGVDLTVSRGDTVAITGRSGEGKTTLLHILGTLEKPSQGELKISGASVSSFNKIRIRRRNIAFIFQSFHLLEDYTALENVLMPPCIARQNTATGSEARKRAFELLEKVGLKERAHFRSKQLSGGEKQRVAIARALCNDPDIIFADEPTGNLDSQSARHVQDILFDFVREQNKSLIVVTHDKELASLCSHEYRIQDGKLMACYLNNTKARHAGSARAL